MKKLLRFIVLFVILFILFNALISSGGSGSKKANETSVIVKADSAPDDDTTRKAICDLFENNGLKIERVMYQPLIERDPGLYGGQERWTITLEDGEQITAFVIDGTITFCYGGVEYDYLPLY